MRTTAAKFSGNQHHYQPCTGKFHGHNGHCHYLHRCWGSQEVVLHRCGGFRHHFSSCQFHDSKINCSTEKRSITGENLEGGRLIGESERYSHHVQRESWSIKQVRGNIKNASDGVGVVAASNFHFMHEQCQGHRPGPARSFGMGHKKCPHKAGTSLAMNLCGTKIDKVDSSA